MPSPRELLLARHRGIEPRLDALRISVLANETSSDRGISRWWEVPSLLWRELVAPCRPVWTGLLAAWAVLLMVNTLDRAVVKDAPARATEAAWVIACWREQQRVLREMTRPAPAVAPVRPSGRQSSEPSPSGPLSSRPCAVRV
jgi:hypothetical protein